jgi:GntR family transcriptional regulator
MIERARGKRPRATYFPSETLLNEEPVVLPTFTYEVLSAKIDVAPWRACLALGKKPGAMAWQLVRLRLLDGEPHSVTVSYQPEAIGRSHAESDLKCCTIPELLARAGAPVLNVDREVSVAFAPTMVAQPLDVFLAQTVLLVTVTLKSHERDAVDWSRIYYRPGRSQRLATVAVENGPSD